MYSYSMYDFVYFGQLLVQILRDEGVSYISCRLAVVQPVAPTKFVQLFGGGAVMKQ